VKAFGVRAGSRVRDALVEDRWDHLGAVNNGVIARPVFVTRGRNAIAGQREKLRELRAGSRSFATFGSVKYEPERRERSGRPVAVGMDGYAFGVLRDHDQRPIATHENGSVVVDRT